MEKLDFSLEKPGTAVWTKVSGVWWPGEITVDYPPALLNEKKQKEKICVVKFCLEGDYQAVFKPTEIKRYDIQDREDQIRRSLNKLKSLKKPDVLEHFQNDVKNAEKIVGGDVEIFEKINSASQTPKRPVYAGLFKSAPPAPVPAGVGKHGQIKFNFTKTKTNLSPKKTRASTGSSSPSVDTSGMPFVCDVCGFGTNRVGTLTAHRRSHTTPFRNDTPPRKLEPMQSLKIPPKVQVSSSTPVASPIKTKPTPIAAVAEVVPSPKKGTPKKSPVKVKEITKSAQKTLPPKKRKHPRENAKKEILADWIDDDAGDAAKDEISSYQEKSDEDEVEVKPKVPRKTDKEIADQFEALLIATKPPTIPGGDDEKSLSSNSATKTEDTSPTPDQKNLPQTSNSDLESKSESEPELTLAKEEVEEKEKSPSKAVARSVKVEEPAPEPTPTPEPTTTPATRRRGRPRASERPAQPPPPPVSSTPKTPAAPTPTPTTRAGTRSSTRNQAKTNAVAEPTPTPTKEMNNKIEVEAPAGGTKQQKVSKTSSKKDKAKEKDQDQELLNATEELLNETKPKEEPKSETSPPRLSNSTTLTKGARKEMISSEPPEKLLEEAKAATPPPTKGRTPSPEKTLALDKREASPKRALRSSPAPAATSPTLPKPPSPSPAKSTTRASASPEKSNPSAATRATSASPEKATRASPEKLHPPAVPATPSRAKSPATPEKSPPLPKLIPTPPGAANQQTTPTKTSPITNNKSEASASPEAPAAAAPAPSKPTVSFPAAKTPPVSPVKVAPAVSSTPPALVPVGTKTRVPSSPQSAASAASSNPAAQQQQKPSPVKVQVTSSPPKLLASQGMSYVTPNEKVVVSQIIATTTTATTGHTSPTKVLVSSIVPRGGATTTTTTAGATPTQVSQKVLVTPTASGLRQPNSAAMTMNNVRAPTPTASSLARAQTRPQIRAPVQSPARGGSSVPPILRTKASTASSPARTTVAQVMTGPTGGIEQQFIVATKSTPASTSAGGVKPPPTIAFAQKSAPTVVTSVTTGQKSAPPALLTTSKPSAVTASAVGTKSTVATAGPPKTINILAQKSTTSTAAPILAQKSNVVTVANVAVSQNNSSAATAPTASSLATTNKTTATTPASASKTLLSALPPLGPPPPIPGIATSVSQEMLAAVASQPSVARKRPKPKPKTSQQATVPAKKGKLDAAAGTSAGQLQANNRAAELVAQTLEGLRGTSSQPQVVNVSTIGGTGAGGSSTSIGGPEVTDDGIEQVVHMIPVDQPDGTTRYLFVHYDTNGNGEPFARCEQGEAVPGRIIPPQDQDRVEGILLDRTLDLTEVISTVQAQERVQHQAQQAGQGQVVQIAQQQQGSSGETDGTGATGGVPVTNSLDLGNLAEVQQHLINNGAQLQLIDDGTGQQIIATDGTQQFALDQQQLDALTAAGVQGVSGDGSEQVFYYIDYNGDDPNMGQIIQFVNTGETPETTTADPSSVAVTTSAAATPAPAVPDPSPAAQ